MIFDWITLYDAYKEESLGRRNTANYHKYTYDLEGNLFSLAERLNNGMFHPAPLQLKTIPYPKRRVAQIPSKEDKIVQHAVCDYNAYFPLVEPLLPHASANTRGRGTDYGIKRIREDFTRFFREYHRAPYILKCDIHNFFGSIPHDRAKELIRRYITDESILNILNQFIDLNGTEIGLPLGLQQSQLIANLYLNDLDHIIVEEKGIWYYGRHMDDFYIFSDSKEYLEELWKWIDGYVQSIGLELNPKTGITYRAAEYLGFKIFISDSGKVISRLQNSKKKTKRHQLRRQVRELSEGKITPEQLAASYQGWRQHASKGNTHNMILAMDDYLNGLLAPLGLHMRMQYSGRKKLKTGQWRKKWRVVIEPALKGEINIEQNNS